MRASQNFKRRPSVFISGMASVAIPVAHELVRDALVLEALDPEVRSIEFIPTVAAYGKVIALDVIVLRSAGGRQVLDIPEIRLTRSIDDEGLALLGAEKLGLSTLTMTVADILAADPDLVWIRSWAGYYRLGRQAEKRAREHPQRRARA
jgi:hypothetical protein